MTILIIISDINIYKRNYGCYGPLLLAPMEGWWPLAPYWGPLAPLAGEIVGPNDQYVKCFGLQPPKRPIPKSDRKQSY